MSVAGVGRALAWSDAEGGAAGRAGSSSAIFGFTSPFHSGDNNLSAELTGVGEGE